MKKTLVLAAVAIAGALTASAQSNVYSLNIVGYVNTVLPPGLSLVGNPLNAVSNTLNGIMSSALPTKASVITFNAGTYTTYGKTASGWPNVAIPTGTGFFVNNNTANPITNTFVGNVGPAGTFANNTNTQAIPVGFSLVTMPLPIGGNITNVGPNTINLSASLPAKSSIITFSNGVYTTYGKTASGFPSVPLSVGQGFYINTPNAGSNWVQIITP